MHKCMCFGVCYCFRYAKNANTGEERMRRRVGSVSTTAAAFATAGGSSLSIGAARCAASSSSSSSSAGAAAPTGSLSLGLDFSKMNFSAMAKNTNAAVKSDEDFRKDVMLGGVVAELDSLTQSITNKNNDAKPSQHSSRVSVPSGTVTKSPLAGEPTEAQEHSWKTFGSLDFDYPAARRSKRVGGGDGAAAGGTKRTLKERLQDCVVSGNWTKAMQLFSRAVSDSTAAKASSAAAAKKAVSVPTETPTSPSLEGGDAEQQMVPQSPAAVVAAEGAQLAAAADPNNFFHQSIGNVGLARWNGNHVQNVLRCVVNAEIPTVLKSVWHVVTNNGVMKHRFDAHNLNSIIGMMARKPHQQSEVAGGGAAHSTLRPNIPKEDWEAFLEEWRQVRRQVIMDVGAYATATQTPLNEASQRTYQRIMENQQRRQLALDVSTSTPTNDGALPVGSIQDFNRLLDHLVKREGGETPSHSTDAVEEGSGSDEAAVLATTGAAASWTVESLLAASSTSSLRWNERTYSILLHRLLRQQHRAVNRAKSETAATAGATPAQGKPTESMTLWEASPKLAEAEQLFARYLEQIGPLRSPAPFLVADMMEFVKHRRAMDHRVYQLVALLLVPEARSDFVDTAAKITAGEFSAVSLAHPQGWAGKSESHLPSAKVFEILIRHALHMQRYDECRFWYDEMRHLGIRGTGVSYHTMMELATKGNATKRPGVNANVDVGPQKDILEVYGQMKEVGLDVTNLSTTVSLINAWSNKNHFKRRMR